MQRQTLPDIIAARAALTFSQYRDLERCVRRYRATAGTYDYPNGDAIALRCGRSLAHRGLVWWANQGTANRRKRYLPTSAGLELVPASATV